MLKRVILITGTPCVGKTLVSQKLASKLDASNVNLTELATKEKLVAGKDEERNSIIVDEKRMKTKIRKIIRDSPKDVIVDGHYAVNVVPEELVSIVFVLRRDPVELEKLMKKRGFSGSKLWENLTSEILDVCLIDALNVHEHSRVCELNISGKSVEDTVNEILAVLEGQKECLVGVVDWIGKLESEGLLDKFLKV